MEIFKGAGVKHHDVEKFWKLVLVLFRPKVNFGAKQKVELQTFVLERHPKTAFTFWWGLVSGGWFFFQQQSLNDIVTLT